MPIPSSSTTTSDLEKILSAVSTLRSANDIFEVFGIGNLPQPQKYGIILGIVTFTVTVSTVVVLLILGGSFKRIANQAEDADGGGTIPNAIEQRLARPLLLERLLEASDRMVARYECAWMDSAGANGKEKKKKAKYSILTEMLLNVAPDVSKAQEIISTISENKGKTTKKTKIQKKEVEDSIPEGYQKEYIEAYKKCQEKPGGSTLAGLPEARYEAYARAYAGCGTSTSTAYRRSYARLYEAISCANHSTEKKYREQWIDRPMDIVGRTVRLEPLERERHLDEFWRITCGEVNGVDRAFDPNEVWSYEEEGPFEEKEELAESFIFRGEERERGAKFAIFEHVTDKMIGVVILNRDDPKNLSVSLDLPIVKPSSEGTVESIEACFLLMDRLFAHGYRRIQLSVDSMDTVGKKLCGRVGFTQEGTVCKNRIVKESNRDSIVYGMLNSDWDRGARAFLYKKLHGDKAMKVDKANNEKEEELEAQQKGLAEMKAKDVEGKINKP